MLYDPKKWDQTKTEPFTRAHVIAWLETKDPRKRYCYTDNGKCLVARYLTYLGHHDVSVGPHEYSTRTISRNRRMPGWLILAARYYPHTFGGALQRARDSD